MSSCTMHSSNERFHIIYSVFCLIAGNDLACASVLRILEQKTDKAIEALCKAFAIPDGELPPDVLLWIDEREVSLRELALWCCGVRGKSTLARALDAHDPRSLIALGLVKLRYVARPATDHVVPIARVRGLIQRDNYGTFVVVDDQGYYEHEGVRHSAIEDGYAWISKQYLYDFDVINARIAKLDGRAAPEPLPRWTQKSAPVSQETPQHKSATGRAKGKTKTDSVIEGGYSLATTGVSVFRKQNTTEVPKPSIGTSNEAIRHAPWNVLTLLSLIASVLAVPPRPSDSVALAAWLRDWYEPAQWLLKATADLDPARAWAHIERQSRGMVSGPTWHAKNHVTITARHVVGWDKDVLKETGDLRLTGRNWRDVGDQLDKVQWWPDVTTPYDGPPLECVEESPAIAPQNAAEPQDNTITAEEPVAVWGMTRIAAQSLCSEMWQCYPRLSLTVGPVGNEHYFVCMEVSKEHWYDLANEDEWRDPSQETRDALEQALAFVGVPTPTDSDGDDDMPRTEPLNHVALPPIIEAAELPTSLVPLVVAPPPKTGMSLFVAEALLSQILAAGYTAELRVEAERALIAVETQAGTWQDFDSSAAWQRYRKSSMPPPGSIGAIAAQALGRAGLRSQAVRP